MKSPTWRVGTIEPEGILKGSTRKERSRNTARITGKKLAPYSTHQGSLASLARFSFSQKWSRTQITPVTTSRTKRIKAKSISIGRPYLSPSCRIHSLTAIADAQHREEGFLRDFHAADHFHALLAGFLLLQQLLLARDI